MGTIVARGALTRRDLSKGGIAGVVVGVCVAFALVALCFYPIIRKRISKRHQRPIRTPPDVDDPETGEVPARSPTINDAQRRLSSQDSFKPQNDIARGGIEGGSIKDLSWTPHDNPQYFNETTQPPQACVPRLNTIIPSTNAQDQQVPSDSIPRSTPFNSYGQEYMPQSIGDAHDVLNGTSADYYSPSIPSEAFGMYTSREPQQSQRTLSRGSSFRNNLKQYFSRKSTRDQSMNSPTSTSLNETRDITLRSAPPGSQDNPVQCYTMQQDRTESPVEIEATDRLPPQTLGSPINLPSDQPSKPTVQTPPQSSSSAILYKTSPPTNPAPGTVNPMDIMPASNEREMWHRTEHELYLVESSPNPQALEQPRRDEPIDSPSPFTLPPDLPQALPVVQSATPVQNEVLFKKETLEEYDTNMADIPSHEHLSPLPEHDLRHPSYPSDASTPLPGPVSTNPSTLNTPATQLDTPSPHSGGASDYRHSASPGHVQTNLSPKHGSYPCNEPGCHQIFDQPHKLKHHQRYHIKDHKCHYPNCGKGFGTKTHLQRHINDRHEKKKKFHCAVQNCEYSRQGGKGFPRKDNWKRHMTKIHNMDQKSLPEPEEVDQDMGGV